MRNDPTFSSAVDPCSSATESNRVGVALRRSARVDRARRAAAGGRALAPVVISGAVLVLVAGTFYAVGVRSSQTSRPVALGVLESPAVALAIDDPTTPPTTPPADGAASTTGNAAQPPDAAAPDAASPDAAAPTPSTPPAAPAAPSTTKPVAPAAPPVVDPLGRRADMGAPTKLSFRNVSVEQIIPFIVESTGKVVLPQTDVLARRITVLNDKEISRQQALDLIFLALQQAGVAVVESKELILLRDQGEVDRQSLPVIPADQSLLDRTDVGSVVQKIFQLKHGSATNMGEVLKPSIPDYAKLAVDGDSNQLLITGPVALLQRLERVISSLDRASSASLVTQTFFLQYADAEQVSTNVKELFSDNAQAGQAGRARTNQQALQRQQQQNQQRNFNPFQQQGQQNAGSTSANLRVTFNTQQNSVTVLAEQTIIDQVKALIDRDWDRPVSDDVAPRVYQLKNSDPVKLRDLLEGLFGQGTQTPTGTQNGQRNTTLTPGVGRLAGQFSFQAVPEAGRLIVVSRSPANFDAIDQLIAQLDQPTTSGLPEVVELKHANAEDLSEQLNALLAKEGTLASVQRSNNALSQGQTGSSPFSSAAASSTAGNTGTTNAADQQTPTNAAGSLSFWWQRATTPTDTAGTSNLVARARIVPVARQNAVMILAPMEYKTAIAQLVERLDRPGRQVLIAAVIAEVSGNDTLALGTRFGQSAITPTSNDNTIGTTTGAATTGNATGPTGFTGQKTDLLPGLFNSSVLNVGVNISAVIQALASKQEIKILSEPRIFTADNQEATFFDGQDIPFITQSQPNTQGNLVQSFDYRAVGIQLRVRPRITPERDVDLKVNLQLSSVVTGQTLFGGAIIDRRETTTQLIVQDGQTVVISGILRNEDSDIKRKVPILGDIPVLDFLFSSTERIKTTTELVAFITPIVVNNRSESDAVNDPLRARLGVLRGQLDSSVPKTTTPGTPAEPDRRGSSDDQ